MFLEYLATVRSPLGVGREVGIIGKKLEVVLSRPDSLLDSSDHHSAFAVIVTSQTTLTGWQSGGLTFFAGGNSWLSFCLLAKSNGWSVVCTGF